MVEERREEQKPQKAHLHRQPPLATRETKELDKTMKEKDKNPTEVCRRRSLAILLKGACIIISTSLMGDLRELDLETRVITNGNNKTPRCFTVVH